MYTIILVTVIHGTGPKVSSSMHQVYLFIRRVRPLPKHSAEHSAESRGFSPRSPVSSHRESRQGGLGLIVRKIMRRKSVNIYIVEIYMYIA